MAFPNFKKILPPPPPSEVLEAGWAKVLEVFLAMSEAEQDEHLEPDLADGFILGSKWTSWGAATCDPRQTEEWPDGYCPYCFSIKPGLTEAQRVDVNARVIAEHSCNVAYAPGHHYIPGLAGNVRCPASLKYWPNTRNFGKGL